MFLPIRPRPKCPAGGNRWFVRRGGWLARPAERSCLWTKFPTCLTGSPLEKRGGPDPSRKDSPPCRGVGLIRYSTGKRVSETMAGRFERLRLFHWPVVELMRYFHLSPGEAVNQYIQSGSYPGCQSLLGQPDRWRAYLRDSIIEPAIGRDILNLEMVRKPALLRQVYAVSVGHPAEVVSLQKLAGSWLNAAPSRPSPTIFNS